MTLRLGAWAALLFVTTSPVLAQPATMPPVLAQPEPTPPAISPLSLIDRAIADGRLGDAEEIIRRAPLEARDPELRLRQAELALAAGRMAESITGFGLLTDEPMVAARAQQGLGISRLRRSQLPEAAAALAKAVSLDPSLLRAQRALGIVADQQRDWKTAEASYAKALVLAPGDPVTLSNRGWSRMLRGLHGEAEADLAAAVAADPSLKVAAENLRLSRAMQGQYEEAFQGSTRESLAADLDMVGYAALTRGDLDVAEVYFRRAQILNPQFDKVATANIAWIETERSRLAKPEKQR